MPRFGLRSIILLPVTFIPTSDSKAGSNRLSYLVCLHAIRFVLINTPSRGRWFFRALLVKGYRRSRRPWALSSKTD